MICQRRLEEWRVFPRCSMAVERTVGGMSDLDTVAVVAVEWDTFAPHMAGLETSDTAVAAEDETIAADTAVEEAVAHLDRYSKQYSSRKTPSWHRHYPTPKYPT